MLCKTGKVGFAPEPHLHVEAHFTDDMKGPSVMIELVDRDDLGYVPEAGCSYGPGGLTDRAADPPAPGWLQKKSAAGDSCP